MHSAVTIVPLKKKDFSDIESGFSIRVRSSTRHPGELFIHEDIHIAIRSLIWIEAKKM
jgi:hypothetical protein